MGALPVGLSALRPAFLALLLVVPAMVWAWRRWPPPLARRRSLFSLALRVALVALLVFALAGVRVELQPQKRAVVAVVDLSDSARADDAARADAVRSLIAGKGPDDLFGIVTFGHDAAVEMPLTQRPQFDTFTTKPDPRYTDLAGALRLAAGLVPDGYARQLVLVSDGQQNLGDAASTVAALRAEGVRVDVVPIGSPPAAEALVAGVDAPSEMREGQVANITVRLRATSQAQAVVTLAIDDKEIDSRSLTLPPGTSSQSFSVPGLTAGLHRVRVEMQASPDTYADNNVGAAAIRVLGRPQVLVLEGTAGEGANVAAAFAAAGVAVDRRPAAQAPSDTTTLGKYDATVVVDAPADAFPAGSLAAIAASVKDLGHGLVAVGGPTSYGPGGWQGTPLEDALPVRMDLPPRQDKPKVAVVLVMETMEDPRADQVALGAAEAVIDKLQPEDQVAVTDGAGNFVVPLQPVTDKKSIDSAIEHASLRDTVSYGSDLKLAGDALLKADAPLKHIVLLGDGDAASDRGQTDVKPLLDGYRAKGITTSTVAIDVHGQPPFMAFMQDIANWGGGRFYVSNSPSQVPDLFLKETQTSLRPWFEQNPFFPKITAAGNLLSGVPLNAFPQLGGYVVSTSKPGSEVYFTSTKEDPVLAAWSYGLGRSVAWTSDSNGVWTASLLRSPLSASLFGHMLLWALPSSTGDRLSIQSAPSGDGFDLTVTAPTGVASGGSLSVGVVNPDLTSGSQSLVGVGPGRWQGHVSGSDVGTYLVHAALTVNGSVAATSDAAVALPYSPEYLDLGRNDPLLRQLAKAGAGAVLASAGAAWRQAVLPVPISTEIFWFLLLLCALLWPLDIAIRRLTLAPRQLGGLVGDIVRLRRPSAVELAAPEELVRLRSRVSASRRRRVPAVPPPVLTEASGAAGAAPPEDAARPAEEAAEADEASLSARLLEARKKRGG